MSLGNFSLSSSNPNDQIGGGGCVCSPTKTDCAGPYAIFQGTETDSNVSPHVVLSLACAEAFAKRATAEDALATSADVIDSTADEIDVQVLAQPPYVVPVKENPTVEDVDLLKTLDDIPEL